MRINKLNPDFSLATGEISIALGRGRHTTRHVELHKLFGGLVADTPGFSSLDFDGMSKADIRDNFIEFNRYRELCKFSDCMHQNEQICEIKNKGNEKNLFMRAKERSLKSRCLVTTTVCRIAAR